MAQNHLGCKMGLVNWSQKMGCFYLSNKSTTGKEQSDFRLTKPQGFYFLNLPSPGSESLLKKNGVRELATKDGILVYAKLKS
jgi:hypothetical protein